MNIIVTIIFIIIFLELLLFLFYFINKRTKNKNKIIILSSIIILILSSIMYFFNNIFLNVISIKDYFLLFIIFLLLFILKSLFECFCLENNNKKIIGNLNEYEKIIDEQGEKNHEYKNQLLVLKGYINNKEKLSEYLNTIIDDHKTGQNYEIRQLSNFPTGGLKEMLYYKIIDIKENNLKYYLFFDPTATNLFEKFNIKLYTNITKVLGVLIDNAIEGALDSKEKEIGLDVSMDGNYIVITISNSYNKNIDIKKIGKKGFTSKGRGHGFGLKLVKEIIRRDRKLELITDYEDNFVQTFLIENK